MKRDDSKNSGESRATTDLHSIEYVEQFRKNARRITRRVTRTQSSARAKLIRLGVHDSKGNLKKNYAK